MELLKLHEALTNPELDVGILDVYVHSVSGEEGTFRLPSSNSLLTLLPSFPCNFFVDMSGPTDSAYANIRMPFHVSVDDKFPYEPPIITCCYPFAPGTRPKHFYDDGQICIQLKRGPSNDILYSLKCVRELLLHPTVPVVPRITLVEQVRHEEYIQGKRNQLFLITNG